MTIDVRVAVGDEKRVSTMAEKDHTCRRRLKLCDGLGRIQSQEYKGGGGGGGRGLFRAGRC